MVVVVVMAPPGTPTEIPVLVGMELRQLEQGLLDRRDSQQIIAP